ncbi:MAG: zf-HC2 domain-containing protein [Tepidiformaceae bacterium]
MARLPFLRTHSRLRDNISAYLDGELSQPERMRFEAHLRGCDECRRELAGQRELKLLLTVLPETTVARSFRLTPEMVAAPRQPGQRHSHAPVRVAQFAAGVAVVALVSVGVIDLTTTGTSSSATDTQAYAGAPTNERASAAPQAVAASSGASGDTSAPASSSPAQSFGAAAPTVTPQAITQPTTQGAAGASNPPPTAVPSPTSQPPTASPKLAPGSSAVPTPAPPQTGPPPADDHGAQGSDPAAATSESQPGSSGNYAASPDAGAIDTAAQPKTVEAGDGHAKYRPVEFGLAGVAIVAIAVSILLARRRRSE